MSVPVLEGLFTADGLIGGHCAGCHRRHFPRGDSCPWCGDEDVAEVTLSRAGTLWAWTTVSSAPPGYDGVVPYGFGVVELPDDELRVVTRLTEADPATLHEGQAVRFVIVPLDDETTTWAYAPA
jgi:uncharacterized protein